MQFAGGFKECIWRMSIDEVHNRDIVPRGIGARLTRIAAAVVFCAILAPAQTSPATNEEKNIQAYVGLLRSDVRKAKSQVISEVMQFDTDQ